MTGRPKDPKTARNKNVLVIGGSGSGKTRFYVKPNLMQCFPTSDYPTSFVVTDPKGTLVLETGQMFQRAGYRVKILNTINFSKSMKYNPFVYIHSEKDVLKLVNTLIANTKGEGDKSAEDFWVKSERLFYTALIGYIWYEAPAEEMNFTTLLEMINAAFHYPVFSLLVVAAIVLLVCLATPVITFMQNVKQSVVERLRQN